MATRDDYRRRYEMIRDRILAGIRKAIADGYEYMSIRIWPRQPVTGNRLKAGCWIIYHGRPGVRVRVSRSHGKYIHEVMQPEKEVRGRAITLDEALEIWQYELEVNRKAMQEGKHQIRAGGSLSKALEEV